MPHRIGVLALQGDFKEHIHCLNKLNVSTEEIRNPEQVKNIEYYKPPDNSPEIKYLKECRLKLGGNLPERSSFAKPIKTPSADIFSAMK